MPSGAAVLHSIDYSLFGNGCGTGVVLYRSSRQ